jgi:hypothetical protein
MQHRSNGASEPKAGSGGSRRTRLNTASLRIYYWSLIAGVVLLATICIRGNASALVVLTPYMGSTVSGTVAVTSNLGGSYWWTQLTVDGNGVATNPTGNYSWDSTTVSNGTHTLGVRVFQEWATVPSDVASTTVTVSNSSNLGSSGGSGSYYFSTLPPHAQLPSGSWCASVIPSTPEKIPSNAGDNATVPNSGQLAGFYANPANFLQPSDIAQVDGQYTGSTDMILRWAACKWGIDENIVRAQAWGESSGYQTTANDWTTDGSLCPPGAAWNYSQCAQTYGILQIKWPYQQNTWPMSWNSTAFNADYRFAIQRACMNGDIGYLAGDTPSPGYPSYPNGTSDQMLWGCIGEWYSGGWYDSGALNYISWIKTQLSEQQWLN